ncbi:Basic 7S globulin [Heracleum sosnowskyi]|uniref:Basic 7S globulin n=1 Tax=Heracleum sosnowskyi TaxID=360622 RepID=A0AAD8HS90_9APIA|nr:Basic 7S globulin [Heracleum sosnowskyi]
MPVFSLAVSGRIARGTARPWLVPTAAKFKQPKPTAFPFPIRKDTKTLQYYTTLDISTRENNVGLVTDLGSQHTCCSHARLHCDSCVLVSYNNDFVNEYVPQSLGEDALFVYSTNGVSVGLTYKSPKPFPFTCSDADLLRGLSKDTQGMTCLGNTTTSLHAQLSTQFKIPRKFALCLPSTSEYALGHMFIGGGPYYLLPYSKDIARELITRPLDINIASRAYRSGFNETWYEYFVNITSISIDHKPVSFDSSLLSFNEDGFGGTTISTLTPYTTLTTPIYRAVVGDFKKAAAPRKMKMVSPVAPFGACYKAKSIAKSQTGPVVPFLDIGLAGAKDWRFYGANSMVSVSKHVVCLALVYGTISKNFNCHRRASNGELSS